MILKNVNSFVEFNIVLIQTFSSLYLTNLHEQIAQVIYDLLKLYLSPVKMIWLVILPKYYLKFQPHYSCLEVNLNLIEMICFLLVY
jgi:hypothetical protein